MAVPACFAALYLVQLQVMATIASSSPASPPWGFSAAGLALTIAAALLRARASRSARPS